MNNTNLIKITQAKWESIHPDYKGTWLDYFGDHPEWKGKKIVMSGCINDDPAAFQRNAAGNGKCSAQQLQDPGIAGTLPIEAADIGNACGYFTGKYSLRKRTFGRGSGPGGGACFGGGLYCRQGRRLFT